MKDCGGEMNRSSGIRIAVWRETEQNTLQVMASCDIASRQSENWIGNRKLRLNRTFAERTNVCFR